MTSQQFLIHSSHTNIIPNQTKNPMTEPKKFCMKGLKDPRKDGIPQGSMSEHDLKILDRCCTPKDAQIIGSDIITKLERWVIHPLICCKFLIKSIFESLFLLIIKI